MHWVPAVAMLVLAEAINYSGWSGKCYWYLHLLLANGVVCWYHTFKLRRYYTRPTRIEVYRYEEMLRRLSQAETEAKQKLNEVLKTGK